MPCYNRAQAEEVSLEERKALQRTQRRPRVYDAERPWTSSLQKLEPPLVQTKDLVPIFTSCLRTKLWRNRENVILHEDNCTAIR